MAQQRPLATFQSRDFSLLWLGNLVSLTGTEMSRAAVAWQIYQLTGSALALGMIGAARLIPLVLLALGAGVLADAFDRRKLMIGAQVAMLLCSLTLAYFTAVGLATRRAAAGRDRGRRGGAAARHADLGGGRRPCVYAHVWRRGGGNAGAAPLHGRQPAAARRAGGRNSGGGLRRAAMAESRWPRADLHNMEE